MTSEMFKLLVDRIETATQRSRWIFSVSIVISMALVASVWNFAAGTLRVSAEQLVLKQTASAASSVTAPSAAASAPRALTTQQEYLRELRKEVLKSWVDGLSISIGLIGMKLAVMDAGLIGGVALLIITSWLFFFIRRENHLVSETIEATKLTGDPETKSFVFWGIASSQIFNTLTDDDAPFEVNRPASKNKQYIARTTKTVMAYLPVIALGIYIVIDFLNVFTLSSIFAGDPDPPIRRMPWTEFWSVYQISLVEAVLLIMMWRLIGSIRTLQRSTRSHLKALQADGWDHAFATPKTLITAER